MNKFLTKLAKALLGLSMAVGVGISLGSSKNADSVSATDVSITSFSKISGSIDDNISYSASKGSGTSDPVVSSNALRIYKPSSGNSTGGYITITAATNYKLNSITINNSSDKSGTIKTKVDSGSISSSGISLAASGSYTISSLSATSVIFYNCGSDRLSIAGFDVTYSATGGGGSGGEEDPTYSGTFNLHSGLLVEGDYLLTYGNNAMKAVVSSSRLDYATVSATNNTIANPKASLVWHIAANGDYWTLYNASKQKYAGGTTTKNQGALLDSVTNYAKWTCSSTAQSSTYDFLNYGREQGTSDTGNKYLRNNGTYGFACYASGTGGALTLYKKVAYSVTYSANGGSGSVPSSATDLSNGATHTVAALPAFTKTGYTLGASWNTSPSGNGTSYAPGSTLTIDGANVTLYAVWTPKSYSITYKDQGDATFTGTHEDGYPTTHTYGTATTLKTANKTGYTFGGWFTNSNCTGSSISSLTSTGYTTDITLYAKWDVNYYDVIDDITNGTLTIPSQIAFGGSLDVTIVPTTGYKCPETSSAITVVGATLSNYDSTNGVVSLSNATGEVTVTATCPPLGQTFSITTNVSGGTYSGDSSITDNGGTASVTITPTGDHKLPSSLTDSNVTGASYTYDSTTGVISLSNANTNVVINVTCPDLTSYTITVNEENGTHTGPSSILESRSATLTFTHNQNYAHPNDVTVEGASKSWNSDTGVLVLSNPTGNVTVTYSAVENTLTGITLSETSGTYKLGDTFVKPTVTAHYTVSGDEEVTSSTTFEGFDPYTTGEQTVTFTYQGQTATYTATVSGYPYPTSTIWTKVTDASTLSANDYIIIADSVANKALSTEQRSNNRGAVDITKNNDGTITWATEDVDYVPQELKLVSASGVTDAPSGSFGLSPSDGYYLVASGSSNNYLTTASSLSKDSAFAISITEGVATIQASGSSNRNLMRSNSTNNPPIFACYKSDSTTGHLLEIYKKTTVTADHGPLLRIFCDPQTGYVGGEKYAGETVSVSDFVVKKQYNTASTLITLDSGYTINGGSTVTLEAGDNNIEISYTEGGVTKTTNIVVVGAIRPAVLQSVYLSVGEGAKLKDYVDWDEAEWDLNNISVIYDWDDDNYDDEVALQDLIGNGATIYPSKPTVGTTSFTVTYAYLGMNLTNNTVTLQNAVIADKVTGLSWTNRPKFNSSSSGFETIFAGYTTLGDLMDANGNKGIGTFAQTWASGKSEEAPIMGTGEHNVHIGIYESATPTVEGTALTADYVFTSSDNGKYVVAFYEGKASGYNTSLSITDWRSVKETASLQGTYDFSGITTASNTEVSSLTNYYSGSLREGSVEVSKFYPKEGFMQVASGSGSGSLTITFDDGILISSVTVVAKQYDNDEQEYTLMGKAVKDLTSSPTTTTYSVANGDFESTNVFTLNASAGKRVNIVSIQINASGSQEIGRTDDCLGLEAFISEYLHMLDYDDNSEQTGWCKDSDHHYYSSAKAAYNNNNVLNDHQRELFTTNNAYAAEYARLNAWARANGETFNATTHILGAKNVNPLLLNSEHANSVAVIVIISMVSMTAIGGYFFLRKRKEQ